MNQNTADGKTSNTARNTDRLIVRFDDKVMSICFIYRFLTFFTYKSMLYIRRTQSASTWVSFQKEHFKINCITFPCLFVLCFGAKHSWLFAYFQAAFSQLFVSESSSHAKPSRRSMQFSITANPLQQKEHTTLFTSLGPQLLSLRRYNIKQVTHIGRANQLTK